MLSRRRLSQATITLERVACTCSRARRRRSGEGRERLQSVIGTLETVADDDVALENVNVPLTSVQDPVESLADEALENVPDALQSVLVENTLESILDPFEIVSNAVDCVDDALELSPTLPRALLRFWGASPTTLWRAIWTLSRASSTTICKTYRTLLRASTALSRASAMLSRAPCTLSRARQRCS